MRQSDREYEEARRREGEAARRATAPRLPPAPSVEIPGSARDDVDRLRMLYLCDRQRDQTMPVEIDFVQGKGRVGWILRVNGEALREGPEAIGLLKDEVADLSRKILLRARSDAGILQLCGVDFTPFDPPEAAPIDVPADVQIDERGIVRSAPGR